MEFVSMQLLQALFRLKGLGERLFPADLQDRLDLTKKIPVGRVGNHQELANVAAYLISDYSAFVNGEVITIDGGEWLKGAGQFNMLEVIPENKWDEIEAAVRQAK